MIYFTKTKLFSHDLFIYEENGFLIKISFTPEKIDALEKSTDILLESLKQLSEYESGARKVFSIPFKIQNMTDFSQNVLEEMSKVEYGQVISYKQLAENCTSKAIRAVASVCPKNPLPIVIPCHRIIRSNGDFGKYLGGSDFKEALINFEKAKK